MRARLAAHAAVAAALVLALAGTVGDAEALLPIKVGKIVTVDGAGVNLSLTDDDHFGASVASVGDLDGDGIHDMAVGAIGDDRGGSNRGAVYTLLMNWDGTVDSYAKIAHNRGGGPSLSNNDYFGTSVASVGDLDGDGVPDLAVGAKGVESGGHNRGAVYILFMRDNGKADSTVKIAHNTNGGPSLSNNDYFGTSVAGIGDMDGDGVPDLAVGAPGDDRGGTYRGAAYVLFMNADGTADSHKKIAHNLQRRPVAWRTMTTLATRWPESATWTATACRTWQSAPQATTDGGTYRGAAYVLFMNSDGTADSHKKIAHNLHGGPIAGKQLFHVWHFRDQEWATLTATACRTWRSDPTATTTTAPTAAPCTSYLWTTTAPRIRIKRSPTTQTAARCLRTTTTLPFRWPTWATLTATA